MANKQQIDRENVNSMFGSDEDWRQSIALAQIEGWENEGQDLGGSNPLHRSTPLDGEVSARAAGRPVPPPKPGSMIAGRNPKRAASPLVGRNSSTSPGPEVRRRPAPRSPRTGSSIGSNGSRSSSPPPPYLPSPPPDYLPTPPLSNPQAPSVPPPYKPSLRRAKSPPGRMPSQECLLTHVPKRFYSPPPSKSELPQPTKSNTTRAPPVSAGNFGNRGQMTREERGRLLRPNSKGSATIVPPRPQRGPSPSLSIPQKDFSGLRGTSPRSTSPMPPVESYSASSHRSSPGVRRNGGPSPSPPPITQHSPSRGTSPLPSPRAIRGTPSPQPPFLPHTTPERALSPGIAGPSGSRIGGSEIAGIKKKRGAVQFGSNPLDFVKVEKEFEENVGLSQIEMELTATQRHEELERQCQESYKSYVPFVPHPNFRPVFGGDVNTPSSLIVVRNGKIHRFRKNVLFRSSAPDRLVDPEAVAHIAEKIGIRTLVGICDA